MKLAREGNWLNTDKGRLSILLALNLITGIYLIATTVMISKDGVLYIELAQRFAHDPISVVKGYHPFGLPLMVYLMHALTEPIIADPVLSWAVSGQLVTFLCKTLAFIPLFYFGKRIIGSRDSFLGLLILTFLPYPAEIGADILRDWPHLLILITGFLCLWKGIERQKWYYFIMAGFVSGLGHMIRVESAQIVIYGLIWIALLFIFNWQRIKKTKLFTWAVSLCVSFAIVVLPYLHAKGEIIPRKAKRFLNLSFAADGPFAIHAGLSEFADGVVTLFEELNETMLYFYFPFAVLGFALYMTRTKASDFRTFLISAVMLFYFVILTMLQANYGYISGRHVMPMLVVLMFFVPAGFRTVSDWLNRNKPKEIKQKESRRFELICICTGIAICLPKLIEPVNYDNAHYLNAARWLDKTAPENAKIATFDKRIGFYSQRNFVEYKEPPADLRELDYMVGYNRDGEKVPEMKMPPTEKFSSEDNPKTVLIYKLK